MSTLYRLHQARSPKQLREGDLTAWGVVKEARRASTKEIRVISRRVFHFTFQWAGETITRFDCDLPVEIDIWRPREDAIITMLPKRRDAVG